MTTFTSPDTDVVADHGNEKARWAATHRAEFVSYLRSPPAFPRQAGWCGTLTRCMDVIDWIGRIPSCS